MLSRIKTHDNNNKGSAVKKRHNEQLPHLRGVESRSEYVGHTTVVYSCTERRRLRGLHLDLMMKMANRNMNLLNGYKMSTFWMIENRDPM